MSLSRSRRMWRLTCASSATLVRPASPVPFGVNLRAIFSVSQPGGVDGSYVLHRKDIAAGQEVRASARSVGAAFGDPPRRSGRLGIRAAGAEWSTIRRTWRGKRGGHPKVPSRR
jgi:hypothetical protein